MEKCSAQRLTKLQNKFQFSNEDPGSLIPYESQEDNLNPSEEEHE